VLHSSSRHPANRAYAGYWDRTQWPLQGLYFLLPLLVLYELGTLWLAPEGDQRLPPIVAESLLDRFFQWFGVTGFHLPAIIAVVVLFCLHLVRRDPWRPEPKLYAVMWVESFAWALPLFVFAMVLVREMSGSSDALQAIAGPAASSASGLGPWKQEMVFSIGAGIYEELLFRLIGLALLHMLFVDVLALPEKYGGAASIALSAVAFSLYHFVQMNPQTWVGFTIENVDWGRFAFYTLAGVYLALIYVIRGFGMVVGTHALYDVMIVWNNFDLTGNILGWFGVN
jgi:Type II CAAX prenyl endopeptidase Rce1-like